MSKPWILVLTMPSGNRYVLGERAKCLAMFPVSNEEPTPLKGVFSFDSEADAQAWISDTAKMSEQGAMLMKRVAPFQAERMQ